jgi:BirA family transcriptional regulator, biotin operon repressor / biotin---[acetyl-CoA-carboxylase] ligase
VGDAGLGLWLGEPVERWRARWGVPLLQIHPRVGSTNDLARDLASAGAPEGATVIADAQQRGRGRRGREWLAEPGASLLLSMVFRPRTPGAETLLSLRLGLAAARAIEAATPVRVNLKWPNDLMIDGLKVAGILCEGAVEDGRSLHLVAGIGINVSQADDAWPGPLRGHASSLQSRARQDVHRATLAGHLVDEWLAAATRDSDALSQHELAQFRRRDLLYGREIYVDGRFAGIAQGIDPDGALRAGSGDAPRRIIAGTVRTHLLDHETSP